MPKVGRAGAGGGSPAACCQSTAAGVQSADRGIGAGQTAAAVGEAKSRGVRSMARGDAALVLCHPHATRCGDAAAPTRINAQLRRTIEARGSKAAHGTT
eukprot:6920088-Prymnesium_polylepis.2